MNATTPTVSPTDELAALSAAATPGMLTFWPDHYRVTTEETFANERKVVALTSTGSGAERSNGVFLVTLWNAYRAGQLVDASALAAMTAERDEALNIDMSREVAALADAFARQLGVNLDNSPRRETAEAQLAASRDGAGWKQKFEASRSTMADSDVEFFAELRRRKEAALASAPAGQMAGGDIDPAAIADIQAKADEQMAGEEWVQIAPAETIERAGGAVAWTDWKPDAETAAALAPRDTPEGWQIVPIANCCHCGRIIDTREKANGGDDWGHEFSDGRWVCSPECMDVVSPAPPAHTGAQADGSTEKEG